MPSPNHHWIEELDFIVAEWTPNGNIVEMLDRIHLYEMAIAAFDAATKMRPTSIIRMNRGAQLLRERGPVYLDWEPSSGRTPPRGV